MTIKPEFAKLLDKPNNELTDNEIQELKEMIKVLDQALQEFYEYYLQRQAKDIIDSNKPHLYKV